MLLARMAAISVVSNLMTALIGLTVGVPAGEQDVGAVRSEPSAVLQNCRERGIGFLRTSQAEDGSWTAPSAPGITALAVTALMSNSVPATDPVVAKALKHLSGHVQKDGGIYYSGSHHRNYETCLVLVAFQMANTDGRYDDVVTGAERFLKGLQWDEGEGLESSDPGYGGAGDGTHERPDLSNTQFLIEALKSAGAGPDDPAMQKALLFVSRCQNLESEHNMTPFAAKVNDGGFYYTPAAGGTSQAGTEANGGLRSYGSMTYAGLKSMIYAGLAPEDRRVQAAFQWITKHSSVDQNPGMDQQGLFYYYQTFAKTLSVLGVKQLRDADGVEHNWRHELVQTLARRQKPNGSWINEAERWYEGDPNLVTAYALLALAHIDAPAENPAVRED